MSKSKIIDLFSGVGGFSLGFEMAGYETVLAIDFWKDAIETYNHNRENKVAEVMSIHDLSKERLEKLKSDHTIEGIIGGPPCQGFSTVGTRDINDERNHLYLEYFRVVKEVMPKFFVIENVKGLLTLNKGMFKEDIMDRFGNLGYRISEPQVLNAADYGVPQHRHRVFFVGVLDGAFEFPRKKNEVISTKDALSDLPSLEKFEGSDVEFEYHVKPQNLYQTFMRENSDIILNHNKTNHTDQTIDIISMVGDGGSIKDLPPEYWNIRKYNKAFQRMNSNLPSHTIDTGHRNYFHYEENRVPSVRECARIQSFPDDFVFLGTKSSQYKQVGNAVPPLLGYEIALELQKRYKKSNSKNSIEQLTLIP
ncbi:DNA cytosine methyltransferase [Evansella cellulosilytica]|uniref:Cytosine-specific methyltransferase n=1 Tax=Evansella cellulosilytica (strain ATCC 21833 / DSM 2522 / FERM P-1141 / JCM 9156 / N-4) TaxID=649639 RepID=E6TR20_EVAC2|nr:DNA cytosine methyltransferase [Evansella cellulosilytica]ADU29396.1 DNA-cytosine methyltransferase [Evansella cellulosilytica DSM 2522]